MEKKKGIFLTIAVLLLSLANIDVGIVNVIVGELVTVFPGVDPTLFSLIMTLPPVIMIPFSLLAGRMCYYYSKNSILTVGFIIYIIGGVGGAFINSTIYQVLFMRIIFGIGAGIVVPLGTAIIADLYDEFDRAKMMGWSNSFGAVVVIAMSMMAAYLCVMNWKYTFFTYLLFIVIMAIELIALPYMPPERTYKAKTESGSFTSIVRDAAPGFVLALTVLASMFIGIIMMLKLPI
ncbi:MAG: arabinose efflux permease, partial [Firmicutes bacterium]|nr:arabinose efflux permease [Bacillota bacterium]